MKAVENFEILWILKTKV